MIVAHRRDSLILISAVGQSHAQPGPLPARRGLSVQRASGPASQHPAPSSGLFLGMIGQG
jgi:hypothetical protein